MKTLEEYIAHYEKHSGEKFAPHNGCRLFFLPERGFCELRITGDMIIYYQLSGDAKFWHDFGELLAQMAGVKALGTICTRKLLPYLRWWGYAVERETPLADGTSQYFARHKKNGRRARCSPAWTQGGRPTAYYITEYLEEAANEDNAEKDISVVRYGR